MRRTPCVEQQDFPSELAQMPGGPRAEDAGADDDHVRARRVNRRTGRRISFRRGLGRDAFNRRAAGGGRQGGEHRAAGDRSEFRHES